MARKVFFSFQYEDVQRAMNVRNSNVIASDTKAGFIDKADFEEVERKGDAAIKNEIEQSIERGNGILTIDISKIADLKGNTTDCCSLRVPGTTHYLWNNGNGRENIGKWVEAAAKTAGK